MRLLAIGAVLRTREVWDRFSAWILEPAERREHARWQQERHAAALAQLKALAPLGPNARTRVAALLESFGISGQMSDRVADGIAYARPKSPNESVEPWHGKASGCS